MTIPELINELGLMPPLRLQAQKLTLLCIQQCDSYMGDGVPTVLLAMKRAHMVYDRHRNCPFVIDRKTTAKPTLKS